MLSNMRKTIDFQNEHEEMTELMLEATDSTIADMFIEDDGEAEIDDKVLADVLTKIPEYDEEKELNKKLDKLTESYIPEELTNGLMEASKFKKMSDTEIDSKIEEYKDDYKKFINNPYYDPRDPQAAMTVGYLQGKYKELEKEKERRQEEKRRKDERREKMRNMFRKSR